MRQHLVYSVQAQHGIPLRRSDVCELFGFGIGQLQIVLGPLAQLLLVVEREQDVPYIVYNPIRGFALRLSVQTAYLGLIVVSENRAESGRNGTPRN